MFYRKYSKRIIDFTIALIVIVLLSPILIIVAIIVQIKLGSPVIFKQKRPGLDEKIFTLYKFRTMTDERDEFGELQPDNIRLTKFGRFLRATSIDELPELWNIVRGDMAVVGPRPQLVRDMVFMSAEQRRRHSVLPGLTGWAQVNGRNNITWEKKLALDIEYIESLTFLNDIKIIFLTIHRVLKREGISAEGIDTSEDYGDYLLREKIITMDEYCIAMEESYQLLQKQSMINFEKVR